MAISLGTGLAGNTAGQGVRWIYDQTGTGYRVVETLYLERVCA